jgi:hypothetical protein
LSYRHHERADFITSSDAFQGINRSNRASGLSIVSGHNRQSMMLLAEELVMYWTIYSLQVVSWASLTLVISYAPIMIK